MYCEPGIICLCYKFANKSYIVVFKSWNDIIKAEMCHRIPIISMQRCRLTIQDTRQRRAQSRAHCTTAPHAYTGEHYSLWPL